MGSAATTGRRWGRRLGAVLSLGIALFGAPSLAQTPDDLAAARLTFNEGKELEKRNAWGEALAKFKKVAGVKMTPQVRFHIALCEENLGNLISAMKGFQLAAEDARQVGSTAAEVAEKAPVRAEALRKRIGTVKINVSGKVITSKVVLDGAPLAAASFGTEIPVDPGAHVVEIQDASGKKISRKELTIGERGAEQVSVEINDTEPPPPPTSSPPLPSPYEASSSPPPVAPAPAPTPPPPSRAPAYIVGTVGLVFLLGAGALFGISQYTIFDIRRNCKDQPNGKGCDVGYENEAALGRLFLPLSGAALGVGLTGVVTASILFVALTPKKSASKAAITIAPTGLGIQIRGVF
jgi:hypothetical protein